eukprot:338373_1
MSDWIETMNDWQSDTPTPEELFFGSVCAWIYLYYGHRKMFGVDSDIVPTINIVFVHMTGATFYIINHYLREARPYMMLLIMYTVLFYLLYYVLLILPVWNEKRISTSKVVWLVIFGLIYAVIFILFEQVAASLMYGTLCRNPKWDPFLPEHRYFAEKKPKLHWRLRKVQIHFLMKQTMATKSIHILCREGSDPMFIKTINNR